MNILLIIIIFLIVVIEILLQLWVNKLRQIYNNSFSWKKPIVTNIITYNRDKYPTYLNKNTLNIWCTFMIDILELVTNQTQIT